MCGSLTANARIIVGGTTLEYALREQEELVNEYDFPRIKRFSVGFHDKF
jgi:hypothetical protein